MWRRKAYWTGKEGYTVTQDNWKWNSEFYKKDELKENSIYSLKPIKADMKLRGVGVSESNVPFLVKAN